MNAPNDLSARRVFQPGKYPLIALFLLMAVAASLAAQLALLRGRALPTLDVAREATIFGITGVLLGSAVGLQHYRRVRGGLLGCFVGLIIGLIAGPISKVAEHQPLQAIAMAGVCGMTLILFTSAYQLFNTRFPRKPIPAGKKPHRHDQNGEKDPTCD